MNYSDLIVKYKTKMVDLYPATFEVNPKEYDIVELKEDGWWVLLDIVDGVGQFITSGGEVRNQIQCPGVLQARIVCEWIYGTNWATHNEKFGWLKAHDIMSFNGFRLESETLLKRKKDYLPQAVAVIRESWPSIICTEMYRAVDWKIYWSDLVLSGKYEGLIFKKSWDTFPFRMGKLKPEIDAEYVVMGFNEGKNRLTGTLGALVGGLFVEGVLTKICTVGGGFEDWERDDIWANRERYLGKVFSATGKVRFTSGALRHPNFDGWREDKIPELCIHVKK